MRQHGCAVQVCYLSVVSSRQRETLSAKAYCYLILIWFAKRTSVQDYGLCGYSCQYAQTNRVGDLTIGDSWGTEMTEELSKGVSFVMCQTEKGKALLDSFEFDFFGLILIIRFKRISSFRLHPLCQAAENSFLQI